MNILQAGCAVALLTVVGQASALTVEHQSVCELVTSSQVTLSVRVRSAQDLCGARGWKCSGIVYTAAPRDQPDGPQLTFISSERLGVGAAYTLFAQRLREGEAMFLFNPDYSTFPAPSGVDYFVNYGAAFAFNGRDYYRELPGLCVGSGKDCAALTALFPVGSDPIVSVNVIYPEFARELAECPR